MSATKQRYFIQIDDPSAARGADAATSFKGLTAASLAAEILASLRENGLYQRWRAMQEDPDDVDPRLGAIDTEATVETESAGSRADLVIQTELPHSVLKHRLNLLIGNHWHLHDVRAV